MRLFIYIIAFTLSLPALAKNEPCAFAALFNAPGKHKDCERRFLDGIFEAQDKVEAKKILKSWKPITGLRIHAEGDYLLVQQGQKVLVNAMWIKKSAPAILWYNGQILVDNSGNPSMGRKLDNLLRQRNATASLGDLLFPRAAAAGADPGRDILFAYSIGKSDLWGSARSLTLVNKPEVLREFMPDPGFWSFLKSDQLRCSGNRIEKSAFSFAGEYGTGLRATIFPRSPTVFQIVANGKAFLIDIGSGQKSGTEIQKINYPRILDDARAVACTSPQCESAGELKPWQEVFSVRGVSDEKLPQSELMEKMEASMREALARRLFGLSVLGNCCGDELCSRELRRKLSIDLVPAQGDTPSKAER